MAGATPIASRLPDMASIEMQQRLPKLDDDDDVGVEKEFTVQREGEPDLKFRGTLIASVAPECYGQDRWREYRVYKTAGGTYVFSNIGRSIRSDERDKFQVKTWREPAFLANTFDEAVTNFFRFDQLAKQLYAKLNIDTTERID